MLGYLVFTGIVVYVKDFKYSHPSVPTGNYSPVRVLSSGLDGGAYVFTMKRLADQTLTPDSFMKEKESGEDAGYPAPGIIYTMECTPHFWNLCADLLPGQDYYARWLSTEHREFAVGELGTDRHIDRKKTRIFNVRGWRKTED